MEVQVNAGQLVRAIASQEILEAVKQIASELRIHVTNLFKQVIESAPSASRILELENSLFGFLLNAGRKLISVAFRFSGTGT